VLLTALRPAKFRPTR